MKASGFTEHREHDDRARRAPLLDGTALSEEHLAGGIADADVRLEIRQAVPVLERA
jgi:hypothetical protein